MPRRFILPGLFPGPPAIPIACSGDGARIAPTASKLIVESIGCWAGGAHNADAVAVVTATCHEAIGVSNRFQLDSAYGRIVAVGLFAHRIVEVLGFRLDQCWGRSILGRRTKAETP